MNLKFQSVLLLFCITICSTSFAQKKISLNKRINRIIIKTPKLTFKLSAIKDGMGMTSIKNTSGTEFLKQPQTPQQAKIWRLKLTNDVRSKNNFIKVYNNSPCRQRKATIKNSQITLSWLGVKVGNEENALDVFVYVKMLANSKMTDWRLKVINHSKNYGIWQAYMPELELGIIGTSGEDDYLLMSPAEGRSVRNPIFWGNDKKKEKMVFELTTDARIKTKNTQGSQGYGFGSHEPYGCPYPTSRGQMQLNAYYQKTGNFYYPSQSESPGLYLSTHDEDINPKVYYATDEPKNKLLRFVVGHYPKDNSKAGLGFEQKYPMVIGAFNGDWYTAASIYRKWALKQKWSSKGRLIERDDIPEWLLRITAWIRLATNSNPSNIYDNVVKNYRKNLYGFLGIQWYAWEYGIKKACGVFPPTSNGRKEFKDTVAAYSERDIIVFPYVNTRIWSHINKNVYVKNDFESAKPFISQNPDGSLSRCPWGKHIAYRMCLFTKFWQEYLNKICAEVVKKYAVKGLYLDQAANTSYSGGSYNLQGCFDKSHKHPAGVTRSLVETEYQRYKAILNATQKYNKDEVLTGEGNSEIFNNLFASKLIHYEIWPGYVPTFNVVYHDYVTSYGRSLRLKPSNPGDPIPEMQTGWQLITGSQLARLWPTNFNNPVIKRNLKYVAQATMLKNDIGYKYLSLGKMLRAPFMSKVPVVTTCEFLRINNICKLPGILAATWESPDGDVAIVLTNIHKEKISFKIGLNLNDYGFKGKCSLKTLFPKSINLSTQQKEEMLSCTLELNPRDIMLIKINGNRPQKQEMLKKLQGIPGIKKKLQGMKERYPSINKQKKTSIEVNFQKGTKGWKIRYSNNIKVIDNKYLQLTGAPNEKYNLWLFASRKLQFWNVAGKSFVLKAKVKCSNLQGQFLLGIRMLKANGKTAGYVWCPVNKNCDWTTLTKNFTPPKNIFGLELYVVGKGLGKESKVLIDSITVLKKQD